MTAVWLIGLGRTEDTYRGAVQSRVMVWSSVLNSDLRTSHDCQVELLLRWALNYVYNDEYDGFTVDGR
jgi:hypothetical protein